MIWVELSSQTLASYVMLRVHRVEVIFWWFKVLGNLQGALYAKNFKRTLTRLRLYRHSLDRQDPNKTTIHLRLLSDSPPASSHLQPIADWLDTGSLPPRAVHPPSPIQHPEPTTLSNFSF